MAISVKLMQRPEPESTSYLRAALSGMALTFRHMINPVKVTQQYPEEQTDLHPRWRGTHVMETHADGRPKCVACGLCPTVCPANCIRLVGGEDDQGTALASVELFVPGAATFSEITGHTVARKRAESAWLPGVGLLIVGGLDAAGNPVTEAPAELFLEAGAAARANYQTTLATRCYRRAIALLDKNDLRLLDAHEAMEAICRNRGRWRERRKHLTRLRQLAKQSKKPIWVATALSATARFEFESGHLAKALNSAQRAEQLASERGIPREVALQGLVEVVVKGRAGEVPVQFAPRSPPT